MNSVFTVMRMSDISPLKGKKTIDDDELEKSVVVASSITSNQIQSIIVAEGVNCLTISQWVEFCISSPFPL